MGLGVSRCTLCRRDLQDIPIITRVRIKMVRPPDAQSEGLARTRFVHVTGGDLILRKTRKDPIGFSGFTNRPTLFSFRHP